MLIRDSTRQLFIHIYKETECHMLSNVLSMKNRDKGVYQNTPPMNTLELIGANECPGLGTHKNLHCIDIGINL